MFWSYFAGLTMFEFINQYNLFLSEQSFPTSHTNCKIELQRHLFALVLKREQNYISTISWNVHDMYFSYGCILSLDIKNPISCQGMSFKKSRCLNEILLLTNDTKISKSSFGMKQSFVSIESQFALVWQALCQRRRKA